MLNGATDLTTLNQTFVLGRYRFRLQSKCQSLLDSLERMLPTTDWQSDNSNHLSANELIDLDSPITILTGEELCLKSLSPAHSIAYLIDCALKFNQEFIW